MDSKKHKILVIGNGSWATAIYKILSFNQLKPLWWVRNKETREFILNYHHNPKYLSQVEIYTKPSYIDTDLKKQLKKANIVVLAVPSKFIYDLLLPFKEKDFEDKIIISAVKGMVTEQESPLEYLHNHFKVPEEKIVSISGPCHAEEVAAERLSYLTFGGRSGYTAEMVAKLFKNRFIKVSTSDDPHGTEYAAILKNIYAILAGICHGLGYGDNFQAVLVSSALRELDHFLSAIYPDQRDLNQTCYSGDLLVTCYSQFSRNRTLGNMLGKGYSIKSAQLEMNMVAEGFDTSKHIYEISRKMELKTPLIDAVYRILHQNIAPTIEVSILTNYLNQKIY